MSWSRFGHPQPWSQSECRSLGSLSGLGSPQSLFGCLKPVSLPECGSLVYLFGCRNPQSLSGWGSPQFRSSPGVVCLSLVPDGIRFPSSAGIRFPPSVEYVCWEPPCLPASGLWFLIRTPPLFVGIRELYSRPHRSYVVSRGSLLRTHLLYVGIRSSFSWVPWSFVRTQPLFVGSRGSLSRTHRLYVGSRSLFSQSHLLYVGIRSLFSWAPWSFLRIRLPFVVVYLSFSQTRQPSCQRRDPRSHRRFLPPVGPAYLFVGVCPGWRSADSGVIRNVFSVGSRGLDPAILLVQNPTSPQDLSPASLLNPGWGF